MWLQGKHEKWLGSHWVGIANLLLDLESEAVSSGSGLPDNVALGAAWNPFWEKSYKELE